MDHSHGSGPIGKGIGMGLIGAPLLLMVGGWICHALVWIFS